MTPIYIVYKWFRLFESTQVIWSINIKKKKKKKKRVRSHYCRWATPTFFTISFNFHNIQTKSLWHTYSTLKISCCTFFSSSFWSSQKLRISPYDHNFKAAYKYCQKSEVRTLLFCNIHETDSDYNHLKLEKSIGTKRYGQEHIAT